jgi:hypothetical protein
MAFGKKAESSEKLDQATVAMKASEALKKRRAIGVQLAVRVVGTSPLLMHRWTTKAIIQMVGKAVGQTQPRGPKDLTEEYEQSYHRNEKGKVAMPCRIVKAAIIDGAIATEGAVTKADLKRSLRVVGYTAPIVTKQAMEMDCRIASNNGSPDMRARAVVPAGYYFDIVVQFNSPLTPDKVVAALEGAGSCIGLCEMRPEKGGEYGTFTIEILDNDQITRILKENSVPEEEYKIPPEFLRAFSLGEVKSDVAAKAMAVASHVNGQAKGKKPNKPTEVEA